MRVRETSGRLGHGALFMGFFHAGIIGFGGVLPFARRIIVERRRWLSQDEFNDLFSLCQFMPGANIVNFAFAFGARHRGLTGAAAAVGGLLGAPVAIVLCLGGLYAHYGAVPAVAHGLAGLAAAASGLVVATAVKIAVPAARAPMPACLSAVAFAAVVLLHMSLPVTMILLLPIAIAASWRA